MVIVVTKNGSTIALVFENPFSFRFVIIIWAFRTTAMNLLLEVHQTLFYDDDYVVKLIW